MFNKKRKTQEHADGVHVPKTKPQKWRRFRKGLSISLTILFFLGIVGGVRALSLTIPHTIENEVDMFVLDYITKKYEIDVEDKEATVDRKKSLEKTSVHFKETLSPTITISKVTSTAIKSKKVTVTEKDFTMYEYIVLISFAYRTQDDVNTTQQTEFSEKLEILQDARFGGYSVTLETPHDYTIATGMSEETKKAYESYEKDARTLNGESLDEGEQGVYKDALTVFFSTYSTSLANAQSLVSHEVYLPELTGTFDVQGVTLQTGKKTSTQVSFIVSVPYTIDGILTYQKTYKVVFENKTIHVLEEI